MLCNQSKAQVKEGGSACTLASWDRFCYNLKEGSRWQVGFEYESHLEREKTLRPKSNAELVEVLPPKSYRSSFVIKYAKATRRVVTLERRRRQRDK
jgi:hypothetical protein